MKLAPNLKLPDKVITETLGILGTRGAGKSNVGVVMAEEMHQAGWPWLAIDPKGDWWGIRSSANGKGPGLSVPIFGGLHGDIPLESRSGKMLAELIVQENISSVLDVSDFTLGERHRFLVDFGNELYQQHRRRPQPRHIFLEEAHEYIPQQATRDKAHLKEVMARIPLQGRTFGLGSTTMSQRSARLHKDVLTQIGTLIVMRTMAPQDRKAIELWIEMNAGSRELVESLPSLADGEAWLWSPVLLNVMQRYQIRRRWTFDSGATPVKAGKRAPASLADVDLDAIQTRMAAVIERAESEDPKKLQQRVAKLQAEIKRLEKERDRWRQAAERKTTLKSEIQFAPPPKDKKLEADLKAARDRIDRALDAIAGKPQPLTARKASRTADSTAPVAPVSPLNGKLPPGERAVLTVCGQYPAGATREQLSILTGYKRSSRDSYIQRLKERGLVIAEPGGPVVITLRGRESLGDDFEPLPTGKALQEYWLERLPPGEKAILDTLLQHGDCDRDYISAQTGYKRSSRDSYIQRLKARQLIVLEHGVVRANDILFEESR